MGREASLIVAIDPVHDRVTSQNFISVAHAIFGMEGNEAFCRALEGFMIVHKHNQNFCIGGYSAPAANAPPSITHAEECGRCVFRRDLQDAGLCVTTFDVPVPDSFNHPFIECWLVAPSAQT